MANLSPAITLPLMMFIRIVRNNGVFSFTLTPPRPVIELPPSGSWHFLIRVPLKLTWRASYYSYHGSDNYQDSSCASLARFQKASRKSSSWNIHSHLGLRHHLSHRAVLRKQHLALVLCFLLECGQEAGLPPH